MQTFKLKKGEIIFDSDKIIIVDDAQKQKRLRLFTSSMWTFFGMISVLRYLKTGDQFLLWTGLTIGIGHFIIVVFTLFLTVKSEISLTDIKSIKVRQHSCNRFLNIKLKNNKLRRVISVDNTDLVDYIETNFDTK